MKYIPYQKYLNRSAFFSLGIIFLLSILSFFHFNGLTYHDEGYILNSSLRITHGQIPYRDFDVVYTPLSFIVTAGFLKVFGISIFTGRLAALSISLLSLFALYCILTLLTKNKTIIFLTLFVFVSWGPTHTNFPWPTMFALCFFLYSLFFYLKGATVNKKNYFFIAGIMTIMTLFAKQNFGTGTLLVSLFSFWFLTVNNKKEMFLSYILGVLSAALAFLLFFVSTSSFDAFLHNIQLYTIQRFIIERTLDTPFLYEGTWISKLTKFIFYTSPLTISLIALFRVRKTKKNLFIIPLFCGMFYCLGIRPTTDYVHISPLIAVACLSLAIIYLSLKDALAKKIYLFCIVSLIGLGLYTAYFSGYYKWNAPLQDNNTFLNDPRVNVSVTEQTAEETEQLKIFIQGHTKLDDYIFVNYYAPFIYFLTDRRNVSPYDFVYPNQLTPDYQRTIVRSLKDKKVKIVVMNMMNEHEQSLIADYVRKTYPTKTHIGGYILFTK